LIITVHWHVLDYNGTLATGGKLSEGVKAKLVGISKDYELYVLIADTYGSATAELFGLLVTLKAFEHVGAMEFKVHNNKGIGPCPVCLCGQWV